MLCQHELITDSKHVRIRWPLLTLYSAVIRPPCSLVSGCSFWFYWVKLRKCLLCTVWVLTRLQNNKKKKGFPNVTLSLPLLSLLSITSFYPRTSVWSWIEAYSNIIWTQGVSKRLLWMPLYFRHVMNTGVFTKRLQCKQVILGLEIPWADLCR